MAVVRASVALLQTQTAFQMMAVLVQVKLREHGFHPDEDDVKWWMFGDSTHSALMTFQVCVHKVWQYLRLQHWRAWFCSTAVPSVVVACKCHSILCGGIAVPAVVQACVPHEALPVVALCQVRF